ncbi:biotin/lipoyl-containing protein [Brevibacillus nitrificans]|uniref:acetyl-CoA carboxylase biotin carboxyl carrier protein n=1 Tax=Brevibacillus nitrificans TaxID=651560 RepID=UPI0028548543|nr:biotin/lipoyl-containing protein [Brevibacillus nitrificans]MDR7317592.1 acetyl-CoA carboxylase biotin carboxyl carrier protein [Brevibacillus nitrificans]
MKLHDIRELIKLVNQSSIEELEWEKGSTSIVIKKTAPAVVAAEMEPVAQVAEVETGYQEAAVTAEAAEQAPVVQEMIHTITSTAVGIFSTSVTAGQKVQSGDVVGRCSVDALQLSQDIVSPFDGEVVELLAEDGQLIDYGKALLTVK